MTECTCLSEPSPLGGEHFSVWNLGPFVSVDASTWKSIKSHLERLGAGVREYYPNPESTTRTFTKKPGPKTGTRYGKNRVSRKAEAIWGQKNRSPRSVTKTGAA